MGPRPAHDSRQQNIQATRAKSKQQQNQNMKLQIIAAICLLSTLAVASPRLYRAGPKQEQDAMKIESLADVQNFAAQFYNKHGDQYQKAAQSVAAKLERAFEAGSTNEQRQKNIENVLIYNADQFGISKKEAKKLVRQQNAFIQEAMSKVSVAEVKGRLDKDLGSQINEGINKIGNQKVQSMVNDARKTVVSSLGLNEKESVQDNLKNLWSFFSTKFDIEGEAEKLMDEAKDKIAEAKQ